MKYWRTPLDVGQVKVPHGVVHIIVERCKGCGFCVEYCPKDVLEVAEEFNKKGYHPPKVKEDGECVNCNLCEMICPDFAIYSVDEEMETADPEGVPTGVSAGNPTKSEAEKEERS